MPQATTQHPLTAELLRTLLRTYDEKGITYCIARNHTNLPDEIGNDIDIVVKKREVDAFTRITEDVAKKHGWYMHTRPKMRYFILYRYAGDTWIYLRIDAVTELRVRGCAYMDGETMVQGRRKNEKGIYIPQREHEFVHLLVHTLFGPAYNRERYTTQITAFQEKELDLKEIEARLVDTFGPTYAPRILQDVREHKLEHILERRKELWRALLTHKKHAIRHIQKRIASFRDKIQRRISPPGRFVAVVGPDGAGKSTTAEHIHAILGTFHMPVTHMHLGFRPCVLPTRHVFARKKKKEGKGDEQQKELETPGLIRFLYYTLDYYLGYFIKIRPLLVRGHTVLGERYYYNFLADPRPKRQMKFPGWLPKLCYIFMPKPHTMLLLSHDPKAIHERRQEHSVEEIDRQIKLFRKLGAKLARFIEIRTDVPAHEVAARAAQKLVAYRLAIFASHPVQYQSPLWRDIAKEADIDPTVYYCVDWGVTEKVNPQYGVKYKWDMPLLEGYTSVFLKNYAKDPRPFFGGMINPGIIPALEQHKYDAVIILGHMDISVWLGFLGAWLSNTPIFLRTVASCYYDDNVPQPVLKTIVKRTMLKTLYSTVSGFLSIGTRNKAFYRSYGAPEKKIFNFPYGVDNNFFAYEGGRWKDKREEVRRELGIRKDALIILFASRISEIKHPEYALDAYKTFKEKMGETPHTALLYVGEGDLRPMLEERVKKENIPDVYFAGFKNQTGMAKYYTISDIFIRTGGPYKGDWGATVNEAMVCGLPVVAADALGAGDDLIYPGENGEIYPLGDTDALAKILEELIHNNNLRRRMSARSKEIIAGWGYKEDIVGLKHALNACARQNRTL